MTQPLRIVIPIHSFEPGGVERVGLALARAWHEAGHEVTVVLGRDEGLDRAQAPALPYRAIATPFSTARFETLWMIWSLFVCLRRQRADVLFCPGNTYAVVCAAMRLVPGLRCPPVVAKISNDLARTDTPWLFRKAYGAWLRVQGRLFQRFVGMAEPMREEIARLMKAPAERIAIIPDPALDRRRLQRLTAIARRREPGTSVHFVAIGRLVSQKNMPLLIRAFARAFRFADRLTIVGDGPERTRLERLVQGLAVPNRVHFTGHLAHCDAWLERADCLLLSSDYEGVPAVVIEAIAAGLPVIATDCSVSMRALLGHGSRGVTVPVGDLDAFAAAIRDALSLPSPGPRDRAFAEAFTLEQGAETYLSVMRALPAGPRPPRHAALSVARS